MNVLVCACVLVRGQGGDGSVNLIKGGGHWTVDGGHCLVSGEW